MYASYGPSWICEVNSLKLIVCASFHCLRTIVLGIIPTFRLWIFLIRRVQHIQPHKIESSLMHTLCIREILFVDAFITRIQLLSAHGVILEIAHQ